jgi:hypothetical protein
MKLLDRYFVVSFLVTLTIVGGGELVGWDRLGTILYEWQTLAAGVLALFGAIGVLIAAR